MIYSVYCVRDAKVGFSQALILSDSDGRAERDFITAVNLTPELSIHWRDLSLFSIGQFDTESGNFLMTVSGNPVHICDAYLIDKEVSDAPEV